MPRVWYKVLANDEHTVIAEGSVTTPITFAEDLCKAVYNAERANLPDPDRFAVSNLHVYPPNTSDFTQPADPEDTIADVLANVKPPPPTLTMKQAQSASHRIIVVARPPQQQQVHHLPSLETELRTFIRTTSSMFRSIGDAVLTLMADINNPWNDLHSSRSSQRPSDFKERVHQFYNHGQQYHPANVRCMLTGWVGNHQSVPAAHIVPRSVKLEALQACGMEQADIDTPRNALLLSKNIEVAFDTMRVSFILPNPFHKDHIVLKCWDPRLNTVPAWSNSTKTIADFEGEPIMFQSDNPNRPFRRALFFQAVCAYEHAVLAGWSPGEPPVYFGTPDISERLQRWQLLRAQVATSELELDSVAEDNTDR